MRGAFGYAAIAGLLWLGLAGCSEDVPALGEGDDAAGLDSGAVPADGSQGSDGDGDAGSRSPLAPLDYVKVWEDDFSSFDSASWSRGLKDDSSDAHIIWSRNTGGSGLLNDKYCGYITDEDAYVENGALMLRNQKRTYIGTDPAGTFEYTSGWVNSMNKRHFNGTARGIYLEVRAKFPRGNKVWPAVWLVAEIAHWPPEVDIWEYFGTFFDPTAAWGGMDEMHLRYIWGHYTDPQNAGIELQAFDARYDCEAWHVYGYQWTATEMVWSIDGVEVGRLTSGIDVPEVDWPNEELSLVMNNAVMDADLPDETNAWPNFLTVDHLALYEHTGS